MAIDAGSAATGRLRYTIHVRPSRALVDASWRWSTEQHAAFAQVAGDLSCAAAFCVIEGAPVCEEEIARRLAIDGVQFCVTCSQSSIFIFVTDFTGPDSPGPYGPGGGTQQPHSAEGLVLGLRGSGKSFHLVVFQGHMLPMPVENTATTRRVFGNNISRAPFEVIYGALDANDICENNIGTSVRIFSTAPESVTMTGRLGIRIEMTGEVRAHGSRIDLVSLSNWQEFGAGAAAKHCKTRTEALRDTDTLLQNPGDWIEYSQLQPLSERDAPEMLDPILTSQPCAVRIAREQAGGPLSGHLLEGKELQFIRLDEHHLH